MSNSVLNVELERRSAAPSAVGSTVLLGHDARIQQVLEVVRRVADAEATVLIRGETGTGKELIARLLHAQSRRARAPLVAVNCGALPESLLEAELFGAARGAYTGAIAARVGKFEAASDGTIFLDEVASMSSAMQVALLRVLQSGEFTPVGATQSRVSTARVVAAVNSDLKELVAAGQFRADLYYRLNVIQLDLPPLRERTGDLPLLAEHFLAMYRMRYRKPHLSFSPELLDALCRHDYPGNVRELENLVHRAVVLAEGDVLSVRDLPRDFAPDRRNAERSRPAAFHSAKAYLVEGFERDFLVAALGRAQGVITEAARQIGLSERVFHVKLRKYGIQAAPN
jgi:DNA-binding NtrC family response regulator